MKMMQNSGRVVMMKTKLGKGNPVWVDDKEEKASINIAKVNRLRKLRKEEDEIVISGSAYVSRLRAHHVKLNPGIEWAQLDSQSRNYSSDDEDSDIGNAAVLASGYKDVKGVDDILRTNEDLVVKSSVKLLPGLLEYSRLVDANADDLSNAPINSVQFHRNAQLLLTAGCACIKRGKEWEVFEANKKKEKVASEHQETLNQPEIGIKTLSKLLLIQGVLDPLLKGV
ncbi:unnamed protein product [Camellia sinensis]